MASIDTLAYAKKLEAGGVDRKAAEAHAEAMSSVVIPELATKNDLRALSAELMGRTAELERRLEVRMTEMSSGLEARIARLETRVILAGIGIASIAITVAKLIP